MEGDPARPGRFYIRGPFAEYHNRPQPPWPFDINTAFSNFSAADVAVHQRLGSRSVLAADNVTGEIKRTLNADMATPLWTVEPGIPNTERVVSLAIASARPGVAWDPTVAGWCYAAARSGRVYYKRDVNSGLPWESRGRWDASASDPLDASRAGAEIRAMAVNPLYPERVYLLTADKMARSTDGGRSWELKDGPVGARLPTNCHTLVTHPTDGRTLFVGAYGLGNVGVSYDEGDTWRSFRGNLPTVSVEWLVIENGWLYASTYGRAMWRRRILA